MTPRRRQTGPQTAGAYNYTSAEKLNNPTSETAMGMAVEDIADKPVPEIEQEERVRHPRLQWNRGKQTDHSRTFGPLYIHDKVSPEQFLKTLTKSSPQRDMWALLNGLPEDAAAKPYEYSGHLDQPTNPSHSAEGDGEPTVQGRDEREGQPDIHGPSIQQVLSEQLPSQRRDP